MASDRVAVVVVVVCLLGTATPAVAAGFGPLVALFALARID